MISELNLKICKTTENEPGKKKLQIKISMNGIVTYYILDFILQLNSFKGTSSYQIDAYGTSAKVSDPLVVPILE
jgi:hypothetical protein